MKVNENLFGFRIKNATEIPDIKATLFEAEHEKSGARLLFLDREDENKTFSITFKTIPEDSTGVFHIIEHSVLCGSKKYPVKEPFVELLKGSLNTFLNAMTFPDKTMYPVASRNDKDFLNLMSVYLDAVFHPAILDTQNIFLQEGWHYEISDTDGELSRSGVVLNEMRGSFSSPDEVASYHINEMLYPDTCYRYESGGAPEHIPTLTYESFRAAHEKYYHPSNAEIFLDGSVKLDEVLPLIDELLSEYDRKELDFDIPDQPPIAPSAREIEYEISPNESPKNKGRLVLGYLAYRFDEQEKGVASAVLFDAIASSNESPLKKAIIDAGLCEDMSLIPLDAIKQSSVTVEFKNVKDGKEEDLYNFFIKTVKDITESGIDKKMLTASLNNLEFKMREKDFGTLPIGIIYAMSTLESSLYGANPAQNLSYAKSFESLREKISTDYFEKLLSSLFIENTHRATLVMKPSATLGEARKEKERKELEEIKANLSDKELKELANTEKELKLWQQRPDTSEGLATIPELKISDISREVEKIPESIDTVGGATLLTYDIATNGITYLTLYFDASDLTPKEIFKTRMLLSLIENVKTEKHSAIEIQNLIKSELGSFSASLSPVTRGNETKIYVCISASALDGKRDELVKILAEILYTSVYTDKEAAHNVLRQMKLASDENFTTGGHLAGFSRAAAYTNTEAAILEYYSGYEAHKSMKELEEHFDESFDALAEELLGIVKRIFKRERLTAAITGAPDKKFSEKLIEIAPEGDCITPVCNISPLGILREGILVPSQTSYATLAANLSDFGEELSGSLSVVRSLLSYGYLWNTVRVQGGAYGVGLIVRKNGNVGFYSYRDPSPEKTLECYRKSSSYLRDFAKSDEDITKFIIGAVGDSSPLTTPKLKGTLAASRYLRGVSYDDECRLRKQILKTDKTELLRIADILDKVCKKEAICVVAGKDKLTACKDIGTIIEI